jgi:hypothetical protein
MPERTCTCGRPVTTTKGLPRCPTCKLEKRRAYHREYKRRESHMAAERQGRPQRGDTITVQCRWCEQPFRSVLLGTQPRSKCDACKKRSGAALAAAWAKRHPERRREFKTRYNTSFKGKAASSAYNREVGRFLKYGIDPGWVEAKLLAQDGRCAICLAEKPGGRHETWNIDHDHSCCPGSRSCGKCVRGLLCMECNQGLGKFDDDPQRLIRAAAYLTGQRTDQLKLA